MDLTGRRFLVTGAASGIGRATSLLLARLGAKVAGADIDEAGLHETEGLMEAAGHCFHVQNLKDLDAIPEWLLKLANDFGPLHGFVHAAGIPAPWPLKAATPAAWREVFLINVESALVLIKAFHGRRVYAGANGSVVFISSVMSMVGSPAASVYSMTKAALDGMARSLALELASRDIRVNCVAPGFVQTPMFAKMEKTRDSEFAARIGALHPLGIGKPEDVANAAAFLLADTARWITGTVLVVDGGYTAQ